MTKSLLLVNVDAPIGAMLGDHLAGQGLTVVPVGGLDAALCHLDSGDCDLILLDAQGIASPLTEACRILRERRPGCPILILGAAPTDESGLRSAGATALLAKPFRLGLLQQRIADLLRASPVEIRIGAYSLDPAGRQLTDADGRAIRLTEKETAILVHLHRAKGRPVPRDTLLGAVWGYSSAASTHTVETHIYRLRRKLMRDDDATSLLSTEEGGYRLAI